MTVIRHWIVYDESDPASPHLATRVEEQAEASRRAGYTVEGPFVHADQLTGAVKTLEALEEALSRYYGGAGTDEDRATIKAATTRYVQRVRGGQ